MTLDHHRIRMGDWMNERVVVQALQVTLRGARDQLQQAIADRNAGWLVLARIATGNRLAAGDLRRMARRACPGDPWSRHIRLISPSKILTRTDTLWY